MKYKQHPLSAAFPGLGEEEFRALTDDIDANGVRRVAGDMKKLKKSQAYPRGFGDAVAKVYEEFRGDMIKSARTLASDAEAVDVNLTEMFSLLAGVKQNTKVCSLDYGAFAHIALPRFVP